MIDSRVNVRFLDYLMLQQVGPHTNVWDHTCQSGLDEPSAASSNDRIR